MELIDKFTAGLKEDTESMRKVLECNDFDALCRYTHQLKSACRSYGYPMLTEAVKKLEKAAKARNIKFATTALNEFEVLCQAVNRNRKVNITIADY